MCPSRRSTSSSTEVPTTSSGGIPYSSSLTARTNSTPPPVDDEDAEPVGPQEVQQLDHGPIGEARERDAEPGVNGAPEPCQGRRRELLGREPGVRPEQDVRQRLQAARHRRAHVASEQRLDDGARGQLRVLRRLGVEALQEEERLGVRRPLAPQRAVVVEDGDPLVCRDETGRPLVVTRPMKSTMVRLGVTSGQGEPLPHEPQWPPCNAASIFAMTWSTLKLAGFVPRRELLERLEELVAIAVV